MTGIALEQTWLGKYIDPAIDRLTPGTVVIMEPEATQNFLRPAVERLCSRFPAAANRYDSPARTGSLSNYSGNLNNW